MTTNGKELTMEDARREDDLELARKIAAACIAHRAGLKSIDYTLKHYVDSGELGSAWIELARLVKHRVEKMTEGIGDIPITTTRVQ